MYDKTVRRRRLILALLVGLSLLLLTAYFGEAQGGGLHSVQRGFLTVISPIQDGANKVLKPVRDLFGWFGSTLDAKSQNKQLRSEVAKLRAQLSAQQLDEHSYRELLALDHLDGGLSLSSYTPVNATVFYKSPNIWYSTITIDKGSSAGVRVNDPVINGEGLVGQVTQVASDGALVSLVTDSEVEVKAEIAASGAEGIVQPQVGEPGRLLMQYLQPNAHPQVGDLVVTAGTIAGRRDPLYPKGIPIGTVTSVGNQTAYTSVDVSPVVDLHNLDTVEVLAHSSRSRVAGLTQLASTLTPPSSSGSAEEGASGGQLASSGGGG
ncbi:MAG: rod shape-determining protein MreC [Solirubrobacteraceae bacterium]